jgi:hypothetical protein
MNNKIFTLFIAALLMINVSFGKIFRVGFTGPQLQGVDFTDAQAAHDAASADDTLLFFPGKYNVGTATKKLVYIGYGYYTSGIDGNPNLQLINAPVGTNSLNVALYAGASGSIFEGIEQLNAYSYYKENVNDITIRRCTGDAGVYNTDGSICNNWKIMQCDNMYISRNWIGGVATNLRVENSRITSVNLDGTTLHTGQFNNCYFDGINVDVNNNAINFQNCIFTNTPPSGFTNALFQYCLFAGADAGLSGSHNQFNVQFANGTTNMVFVGSPNIIVGQSVDGKYKLIAGSPAIGAGLNGVDLGMYGGANPYKLSGIPPIPAFYKLTAPSNNATGNPYTITFSVRSNN